MHPTARRLLAAAGIVTLLTACGGGGDGPGPAPAPTPAPPPPMTITTQPQDVTVDEGHVATFSVSVDTSQRISFEWLRDGTVVSSGVSTVRQIAYRLAAATLADDGAMIAVRLVANPNSASSGAFTVTSNAARLTVNMAAPAAPTGLSLSASSFGTEARLRWIDNATNETGYEIYRVVNGQDVLEATEGPNTTEHLFTGLSPGAIATFRVRALRSVAGRSVASELASLTAAVVGNVSVPAAPTNAQVALVNNSAADFTWTDNADNETGFEILQTILGPAFTIDTVLASLPANTTSHRITGLTAGTSYVFKVRAVRVANGTTTRSALASASITVPTSP